MADAEEVPKRSEDVGCFRAVPIHLDEDLAIVIRVHHLIVDALAIFDLKHGNTRLVIRNQARAKDAATSLDEPQMRNCARSFNVGQDGSFAWLDDKSIIIFARVIPAGDSRASSLLALGY